MMSYCQSECAQLSSDDFLWSMYPFLIKWYLTVSVSTSHQMMSYGQSVDTFLIKWCLMVNQWTQVHHSVSHLFKMKQIWPEPISCWPFASQMFHFKCFVFSVYFLKLPNEFIEESIVYYFFNSTREYLS